jgi:hypothetical protein
MHIRKFQNWEARSETLKQPEKWPRPKWMSQTRSFNIADALADLDEVVQRLNYI